MFDIDKLILKVQSISKDYKRKSVVKDVSFQCYKGEILGILGPNGAGKTTIIKMLTGLTKSKKGDIFINSYNIKDNFEEAIKNVGAIVETPFLYEYMAGKDNIKIFSELYKASSAHVNEVIKVSGLENRLSDKVKVYSLGMKQRLGIAVALLKNPKLLILDEPMNGLDPMGVRDLREFLKDLAHNKNVSILISSHTLSEMEKLCDRVIIIDHGEIRGEFNIDDIKKGSSLEDIFIKIIGEKEGIN